MGIVSHDLRSPLTAVIATAEAGLAVDQDPRARARDHRVLRAAHTGVQPGRMLEPGPVRVGEDVELAVADQVIEGHGGRIEGRVGELGLHVPWETGAPGVDRPGLH